MFFGLHRRWFLQFFVEPFSSKKYDDEKIYGKTIY